MSGRTNRFTREHRGPPQGGSPAQSSLPLPAPPCPPPESSRWSPPSEERDPPADAVDAARAGVGLGLVLAGATAGVAGAATAGGEMLAEELVRGRSSDRCAGLEAALGSGVGAA